MSSLDFGKAWKWWNRIASIKMPFVTPKFMGATNPQMHLASDGTKGCFIFGGREPAEAFADFLNKEMGANADTGSFIGYGVVYVPPENYEKAIQIGMNALLMKPTGGTWIDFYDQRSYSPEFEQVLELRLHETCLDNKGKRKKVVEDYIQKWIQKLEEVLDTPLTIKETYNQKSVELGIERKVDSHLEHDTVLNKIRESKLLLEKGPFDGYAYVDFYGKYIA